MFKRYIERSGKKQGPYYYHNFKTHDGKVKSIYLGKEKKKAELKLAKLKKYLSERRKKRKERTRSKKETREEDKTCLKEVHSLLNELEEVNVMLRK